MTCLWGVTSILVVSLHLLQAFDFDSGRVKVRTCVPFGDPNYGSLVGLLIELYVLKTDCS